MHPHCQMIVLHRSVSCPCRGATEYENHGHIASGTASRLCGHDHRRDACATGSPFSWESFFIPASHAPAGAPPGHEKTCLGAPASRRQRGGAGKMPALPAGHSPKRHFHGSSSCPLGHHRGMKMTCLGALASSRRVRGAGETPALPVGHVPKRHFHTRGCDRRHSEPAPCHSERSEESHPFRVPPHYFGQGEILRLRCLAANRSLVCSPAPAQNDIMGCSPALGNFVSGPASGRNYISYLRNLRTALSNSPAQPGSTQGTPG